MYLKKCCRSPSRITSRCLTSYSWSWAIVLLMGLMLARCTLGNKLPQKFLVEPSDVSVIKGVNSEVFLPCVVQNKAGQLQWTRNGFGLGTDRGLAQFPRYKMVGSDATGNYSLHISPVELGDDGNYVCQMMAAEGVEPARSRSASITVLVPPQPPVIVQGSSLQTTAGMQLSLECESRNGKPAAQLEWLNAKGIVISSGVTYKTETSHSNDKLHNAKAILALSPSREHDGHNLTCQAKSAALTKPMLATIALKVKYPPEVTLTLNNPKIMEFDSVTFTCTAKANPDDILYTWYRNNVVIPGNHSTTMTLSRVTRTFHNNAISCEVRNSVGKSKASTTLSILFGPKFKIQPTPLPADENTDVSITCQVEGNPTPDIVWTFEKGNRVLATGARLTITGMNAEKAGRYQCRATVPGFPEIHDYYPVQLKGRPQIRSDEVQYGVEGGTLQVDCNVKSVPPPIRIRWYRNGREIDTEENTRYSITQESLEDGVKNSLLVYASHEADFGVYNCSVTNNFGDDTMAITLKKQKVVPLMIILAGVIGGIAVMVAITIVIVLWVRRYRKSTEDDEHEPEKQSKTSDRSSNDSDLKVEIRTSSSLSNNDSEPWEEGSVDPRRGSTSHDFRYSTDYTEPTFPPKVESHNNNGYVPYVDYQRDYNPPPLNETRNSFYAGAARVDPRYQAAYANPYLRSPSSTLPPPQAYASVQPAAVTPSSAATALSPRSEAPQGQYITTTQIPLKPGTLATHV